MRCHGSVESKHPSDYLCHRLHSRLRWSFLSVRGSWGWGGGNLRVIVVRMCEPVFRNLPYSYIWPLTKTDPFIYFIVRNFDLLIYCPLIFYTLLLPVVTQISLSSLNSKRTRKNRWSKIIRIYWDVRNVGPFTHDSRKIICLLLKKGGLIIIFLAPLKKGNIRHTSVLCHI